MRVLVTGSRDWQDKEKVRRSLSRMLWKANEAGASEFVVVHGACPTGADAMADEWARLSKVKVERHPAEWHRHDNCPPWCASRGVCKRAGFRRNAQMVELGAEVCLAFIRNGSRGASHTARLAEEAGIRTLRFVE